MGKAFDAKRLRDLDAEMWQLIDAGRWTRKEYERILAEANEASGDFPEPLSNFIRQAEPEWREAPASKESVA